MALEYEITSFFPPKFFHHTVNEPFIKLILQRVTGIDDWVQGNPDKHEPDYFCGGTPIEFTLACDRETTFNYIQKLRKGVFESDDIEATVIRQINESIADKAAKKYSVSNVHLCVLVTLPMLDWVSDYYGSLTYIIGAWRRSEAFEIIRQNYISTQTFTNIYIMFPDLCASWWVYDVATEKRAKVQLEDDAILSQQVPFIMRTKLWKTISDLAKEKNVDSYGPKM